ncbi:MAG TPA: phosphoribosyltransferase family protein [Solirubrobacteraceae bacterium]|nr:phosphoribosyltransferase family protein [Solirubrobacteraceae bacterium]
MPQAQPDAGAILRESGALIEHDHFVYISGQHGSGWIDKDAVYPHTERTSALGALIAERVADAGIEVVCGPATGGLILAQWVAHHLGALAVFGEHGEIPEAEHHPDGKRPFVIRRGYDRLVAGRKVLVVDDVVNTGFSIRGTIEAVRACAGEVTTAATVCNRGALAPEQIEVTRLLSLADIELDSWPRNECPLCREGVPVNTAYAHGADFLAAGGDWP